MANRFGGTRGKANNPGWARRLLGPLVAMAIVIANTSLIPQWERGGEPSSPRNGRDVRLSIVELERLDSGVLVSGEVLSLERTTVKMEVEDLRGQGWPSLSDSMGLGPATTILWMVPDGSSVKKGDILCRLDASWFKDQEHLQLIEVERARAELSSAQLSLEVAEAELLAFRDGERWRQEQENRATVALAQAQQARAREHLEWTGHMLNLGFLSTADLAEEMTDSTRAEVELARAQVRQSVYGRYTVPRIERYWVAQVEQARNEIQYARTRLAHQEDRLKNLRHQLERCIIQAPHDGRLIYADLFIREWYQLREGAEVWTGQELFFLPDLDKMGVDVVIPQPEFGQVRIGQTARVRVGAYPDEVFEGRVISIATLPVPEWSKFDDIPVFQATIEVVDSRRRLLPQMSAAVEIITGEPRSRLIIAREAVLVENGEAYCLVAHNGRERRQPVVTRPAGADCLEVLDGLRSGDRVVMFPWRNRKQSR